jgi:hypothetical protein
VVAACFSGENEGVTTGLAQRRVGYGRARRPAPAWWARADQSTALADAARPAAWDGPEAPGDWQPVGRAVRDGHTETWWALEIPGGPYGPHRRQRAVVATTDPATLAEPTTG